MTDSCVTPAMCGERTTFSSPTSGESGEGGSGSNTSIAAARIRPVRSAAASAVSSTSGPRAVFTRTAPAFIRPIVFLLTLPFVLISFGLFLIVINAAMLELTAMMLKGFSVHSFWAAVLGSVVVSLVGWVGSLFIHQDQRARD